MRLDSQSGYFYYFLILFAAGMLCFINLGGTRIFILDEAKNAEAAREMLIGNNWLVPVFNGELRVDKPPLHYWLMMISYKIFGINAFAARFFSALFGVLTIISSYHFTKKFLGRKIAAITAFILCSSIFFVQEFHLAVPDPYLIFFLSFGLFNFYDFYKNQKHSSGLLFYVSIGLAVLAKGPVAIVLSGLTVMTFLIFKKELKLKNILRIRPVIGGLIVLLISVPWFVRVHQLTNGEFTKGFFLDHNLSRFGSEMEGHGGLPIVTWLFVILGLLPFSFFIIQGFVQSWKHRKSDDFVLFSFVLSSVFILFFSISFTKLPNYPMPAYPFVAVLIAFYLKKVLNRKIGLKGYRISLWVLFGITVLIPVTAYILLAYIEHELYSVHLSSIQLAILPAGTALSLYYLKRKKLFESTLALGACFMFLSLELFQFIYPGLSMKSPAVMAKEVMKPDDDVIIYKGYDPALLFNFERTYQIKETKQQIFEFLESKPETKIITKKKFFDTDWLDEDTEVIMEQKALFENYTLVIFKLNRF